MGVNILFADDDPLMQRLYQHHLEHAGFKVVSVTTGRQAVEAARREQPRLGIVDFLMPDMDGLSVVLELKRAEATKTIPVIMITADPNGYRCKRQFMQAGAAEFLSKPFSPAQLLEAVHRLVPAA